MLAATDPANPYGAALPWPAAPPPEPTAAAGHQPARKAGALVVLVDGACVLYVERGGRTLLSFTDDPAVLQPAADALALAVRDGALGKLQVERPTARRSSPRALGAGARGRRASGRRRAGCGCGPDADVPEGDTVWLTAHRLDQALAGRALTVVRPARAAAGDRRPARARRSSRCCRAASTC